MGSYRVRFVSQQGLHYEIRIYPSAEGYDGEGAVELEGAAEPIVTEEDDSSDVLQAVRTSSGYIRVVTDDYELQGRLTPSGADEMRVTLVRTAWEGNPELEPRTVWEGYLQPTAFSQEWTGGPWEIELPIVSRLGVAMQNFLSSRNGGIISVGEWLSRLCGDVYDKVLIAKTALMENGTVRYDTSDIETPTALQVAFSENMFKERVELAKRADNNGEPWKPGTNQEVAGSVCVLFRWVIREIGDTLLVDDPGMDEELLYYVYDKSRLKAEYPTPLRTESTDSYPMMSELCGENAGGTHGSVDIIRPWGLVKVEGNNGKYDQTLLSAGDEDWQKVGGIPYVNGAPADWNYPDTFEFRDDGTATIKTQKVIDSGNMANIGRNPEYESFQYLAQAMTIGGAGYGTGTRVHAAGRSEASSVLYGNLFPGVISGNWDYGTGQWFGGGEVCSWHIYYGNSGGGYTHLRQSSVVLSKLTTTAPTRFPGVILRTTLGQLFMNSQRKKSYPCLVLSCRMTYGENAGDVAADTECNGDDVFYGFKVMVKIGDRYVVKDTWGNHSTWLSAEPAEFDVFITKHNDGEVKEYIRYPMQEWNNLAQDATVEVTLLTPTDAPAWKGFANGGASYLRLDNFRISAELHEYPDEYNFDPSLVAEPVTKIEWTAQLGPNKQDEYTMTTKFSAIDGPSPIFCQNPVTIGSVAHLPKLQVRKVGQEDGENDGARYLCKRTWEWLKRQGTSTRKVYRLPVHFPAENYLMPMRFYRGRMLLPVSMKVKWRDDDMDVTLIEII